MAENFYAVLSRVSGLSQAELKWTAERIHQLMRVEGRPKAEALGIVREESKTKPWESTR